ncbi:MAG TPA: transglutaminase family protein [Gemmataceae bacterium]|nr:transglutaminase family protein [Gemmataceae bacterium]
MKITTSAALRLGMAIAIGSAAPLHAAAPGELVEEIWESAHVEGARVGSLHTHVRKWEADDGKRLRATAELDLTFKRHNALIHLRREHGTEETPEGKVVGVFMRQGQDGGRQLTLTGVLEEGRLHVRVDNGRIERRIRWSGEVIGLYRLEHLFQERKPKTGDHWSLLRYEPTYNTVLTIHVVVKEREEVPALLGTRRTKLWRVEMTADKIEAPGISVQPSPVVWWLDDHFVPVRRQFELDGLGTVILTRTTREAAKAPATPSRMADIGLKTLIPLNRAITRPYSTRSAVYRITLRGDREPASALARDDHQEIRHLKGDTFELHVHPVRKPERRAEVEAAPAEFLESCPFINCDDPRIKELARRAAGDEKDPWAKARRLERWVKQSMCADNAVALGPAGDVARQLRGDCRQYALLTAALCRAEGIPARTAIGLLYVEKNRRPLMGFHMWTEVWIDGQWLGLDATLGQGGVSAAHVKITDHSWHEMQSLTPLLPANRILGKIVIRVLSVEGIN